MSLKAYDWYRVKKSSDFWPLVKDITRKGRLNAKVKLREVYLKLAEGVDMGTASFQEAVANERSNWNVSERQAIDLARIRCANRLINDGYKRAQGSIYRDMFDFDVWVRFCKHRGRVYLNPHADMMMRGCLRFIGRDPRVEDFSYWDNADPPDDVSPRDWGARKRVWTDLAERMNDGTVFIDIVRYDSFYLTDPYIDLVNDVRRGALEVPL